MNQKQYTARTIALQALLQMEKSDGYSNIVLNRVLAGCKLSSRDRALVSAIFYGVLERRLTLDYYISHCLQEPDKKLDRTVMEALRCGIYQIIYMNKVPDSAAVNETVNAVKVLGKAKLAGFVNGVLRGFLRKRQQIILPDGNGRRALSIRYSVPQELIELWQQAYGEAITERLLNSLTEQPNLYIRINTLKCDGDQLKKCLLQEGVELMELPEPKGAGILIGCGAPQELEAFRQGLFHVQDLSAQWVCRILDAQPGETVCDCCAAPGGKSFTLAQGVGCSGKVYALDLHKSRVQLLQEGADRLGLAHVEAYVNDAVKGFGLMGQVDRMLCDVPCSGYGVIRRKPEIRYRSIEQAKDLPLLQYAILQRAAEKVKPGGVLVYSTCTLNPAENREIVERFLFENNGFQPIIIDISIKRSVKEPEYMLTMTPFSGASDGFFVAAFRKNQAK